MRLGRGMGLTLPRRIALLFLIGFFTLWISAIGVVYWLDRNDDGPALPAPERLAALARLVEETLDPARGRVLEAVRTPYFSAWIDGVDASAAAALSDGAGDARLDPEILARYLAALGDRAVEAAPLRVRTRFPFFLARALNAVEFRIGLSTGETLIVVSESPLIIAMSGLPVGYAAGLIGIVIALATLIVLHREFRPLSRLAQAVERMDPEDGAIELPAIRARSPELQSLVGAFERLQDRIGTLIRARLALVGGMQHDIRTFAARLRLRVDKIDDAAERTRAVEDIDAMIRLLEDAMLASRAGARELDQELIDLAPLVRGEVADRAAVGAPVSFEATDPAETAGVLGDRLALRRVVANLIENAVKYGGETRVTLARTDGDAVLTVDDSGPGIPAESRDLLLEPFTRLETSRARRTGGAGLGLAIVRNLVAAHGGTIAIDDAPGGGARLIVRLPVFGA